MNGMNSLSFKVGDFIVLRCRTPEAFLIAQARRNSPDPITLQQQQQQDNIKIPLRWYKRSLSYENGSDLYTPGGGDEIMYKYIICTVNMKHAAQSDFILEAPERYAILRNLREILQQDDSRIEDSIAQTSAEEHTIFGMVPLGVVARTVLNGATFYLVVWKGLGSRYTWESKKFIDENCDGPLAFNESSSRIITFNLGQQPQPPPPPHPQVGGPNQGQMGQRYPPMHPMQMSRPPITMKQMPPYQQPQPPPQPQQQPSQLPPPPPPQHRLTPPDPKKPRQDP